MPPPAKNSRKIGRLSRIDGKLKQNDDSRNAPRDHAPAFVFVMLAFLKSEALHSVDFKIRGERGDKGQSGVGEAGGGIRDTFASAG
jgi:hypothetical protein